MNRCSPFACFRLPGEGRTVREIGLDHPARVVATTAEKLKAKTSSVGFLMAPFAVTAKTPMLWIEEEQEARVLQLTECDETALEGFQPVAPIPQALPDSYRTTFDRFMKHLEEGTAEKLVLAHRVELPSIATAQVVAAFDTALTHYPNAFVSLCYTPQAGLWLCATPEMLLRGDGTRWQTVALAGTMPRQRDGEPPLWSEKNRREHRYVQRFIGELLEQEGDPIPCACGRDDNDRCVATSTGALRFAAPRRLCADHPSGATPPHTSDLWHTSAGGAASDPRGGDCRALLLRRLSRVV